MSQSSIFMKAAKDNQTIDLKPVAIAGKKWWVEAPIFFLH
jgi:hypothetical protein